MKILYDINVILDILLQRKDFYNDSSLAIKKSITNGDRVYLSSSAVTDIYYVVRKQTSSKEQAVERIKRIAQIFNFAEVNEKNVLSALNSRINDYEDAVVDSVASTIKADYIVSRNKKDFLNSNNVVLTPTEFVKL